MTPVAKNNDMSLPMKRHSCSSSDRISELPCNIVQAILLLLPLRDMVKTSVLSRSWRFQWTKVPQLLFENNFKKMYTVERVLGILLLHEGPVFKFTLDMQSWDDCSMISEIIRYLSRNGIQELTLSKKIYQCITLPSSIFSCGELKLLSLSSCVFKPLTFNGFNKLTTLKLVNVVLDSAVSITTFPLLESLTMVVRTHVDQLSVDAPRLKLLSFQGSVSSIAVTDTPLLESISFTGDFRGSKFDLMKLLCSVPRLENLKLRFNFLTLLAASVSPSNLPATLNNLWNLELMYVSVYEQEELASILWLIRNAPNLLKLKIEYFSDMEPEVEIGLNMQGYYDDHHLPRLKEVQMVYVDFDQAYLRPDVEFLKFLLVISPKLEKLYIDTDSESDDLDKNKSKILMELACHRRTSPVAEIVVRYENKL